MKKVNPVTTKNLLREIKTQKSKIKFVNGLRIKVCRGVFPPQSRWSRSSKPIHDLLVDVSGKKVLDIGTGTGVQAIHSAKSGAEMVVATDINPEAVECAKFNVSLNGFENKITVFKSDLFKSVPKEKFDVIIANLPITDYLAKGIVSAALYDPDYKIHKRFFKNAGVYLKADGYILMSHINFKGKDDFDDFEKMIAKHGYKVDKYADKKALGYTWRIYKISRK
ncbi:MAG: 50S ribosomal protein L11 methyltransferase [Patescibacteria group bacterium]